MMTGMTIAATLGLKGLVLLATCALGALALRRGSAAGRHWIWTLGMTGLLVLPLMQTLGPVWAAPVPDWTTSLRREAPAVEVPAATPDAVARPAAPSRAVASTVASAERTVAERRIEPEAPSAASPVARPPLGVMLAVVWLLGTAALLLRAAASLLGTRRLEASCAAAGDGRLTQLTALLARRLGIRRRVRVVMGDATAMPMSWGWFRPVVMLPTGAETWSRSRLAAVLLHELAHVRRADCPTQLAAEVALALHWPNPLAWYAARRMRIEREYACDDLVLRSGARASDYADELIALARTLRPARGLDAAAVAMARPSTLSGRLRAVLDAGRRRTLGRGGALGAGGVAAGLVMALAALTPASGGADATEQAAATTTRTVAAEEGVATPPVTPAALHDAPQQAGCAFDAEGWKNTSQNSNNDRVKIEWSKPGCEVTVDFEGDVEFTRDFKDIARMGRDARVRFDVEEGRAERRLDITPGDGGRPVFAYEVDGDSRPFDASARAWYEAMLLQLFRRAGFHADERVTAMLRDGGVPVVLAELDVLTSDYVFATYARALLDQAPDLSDAQALDVVQRTRRRVDSDYYMAEVLKAFAPNHLDSDRMLSEYLAAVEQIESDFYQAEVLKMALQRGGLTPAQVGAAVKAAAGMESDFYQAEVLTSVAGQYTLEPAVRRTYLEGVSSIESDFYRAEVLKKLLDQRGLTADDLAEVIRAAKRIESDSYVTEVLGRVADMDPASDALRTAYLEVAGRIESDHYRSEVLKRLIDGGRLSDKHVGEVIAAAGGIGSDFYKAEVLARLVRTYTVEGANREAVLSAADRMESSFYRQQVNDALRGR